LARETTSPDDVGGMIAARAVLTEIGGATSHAAVVSRELHTPCVVGCGQGRLGDLIDTEVTVDGDSGTVYAGLLPLTRPSEAADPDMAALLDWAHRLSPVAVLTDNAAAAGLPRVDHRDPASVRRALDAGADAVVAEHPLPVLLTILELRAATGGAGRS
jgi:pyruvate,orthophosphate dikinase